MINIERVIINNFNSIEYIEFDFLQGSYLILGENKDNKLCSSNGSGKSSIIEALVYCLYGKTLKSNHQRKGTNDTYVTCLLSVDDKFVEVTRYYKHYKYKNDLEILVDGELLSYHTKKQKEKVLQDLLKISYDHFVSSVVLIQGFPVRLFSMTSTKIKEYFLHLIDFPFDKYLKKYKQKYEEVNSKYEEISKEKRKYELELSEINGIIKAYSNLVQVDKSSEDIKKELQDCIAEEEKLNNELEEMEKDFTEKQREYVKQKTELDTKIKQIEQLIDKGICPVCEQGITDDHTKKLEELKKELDLIELQFLPVLKNIKQEIEEIKNKIKVVTDKKINLFNELKQVKKSEEEINIDELLTKLSDLKDNIQKKEEELLDLEFEKEELKQLIQLFSPSGELRTIVLKNYIDMFNNILKTILDQMQEKEFKFVLTDYGIEIEGIDYNSFSGGEKRKLDLILQIAFSEFIQILNKVDINVRIFDEVFDNLDLLNLSNILNYIIQLYSNKCLYVISHNEYLKQFFTNTVTVVKENGITKLKE